MRRITWGLTGIALLVLVASFVVVHQAGLRPATRTDARSVAAAHHASAIAAVDEAKVAKPVPPVLESTELVSLKPGAAYLMYSYSLTDPVMGELGPTTWGGPTVRPVVSTKGDWFEIRLDARPNGSTGWVRKQDVVLSQSPYRIVISVGIHSLTLYQNGWPVLTAPVGTGKSQWPTPLGLSFVDQVIHTPANLMTTYGPTVLITGSHSNVLTDFDGGDGTVAIHGYPSAPQTTMGVASSHGCIRANPETMAALAQVPAGSPIDINP